MKLLNPIACAVLLAAAVLVSSGCATFSTSGTRSATRPLQIQLSDTRVTLELPALKVSNDFPPPRIRQSVDLNTVNNSTVLVGGYWDGPRHQIFSVTGTLGVILSVRPWPVAARDAGSPLAKAKVYVDEYRSEILERYKKRGFGLEPAVEVAETIVAGRPAIWYRANIEPSTNVYVIPLDDRFFLRLYLDSIVNSSPADEWYRVSEETERRLLQSLKIESNLTSS